MTKQEAIGVSQTANVKSVMTVRAAAKNGPGVKRKLYIGLMKFLMGLSITITCGLVLFMIGYVLYRGVPNISWKLVSTSPSYLDDNIGILPDILNTLYIVIATLVIVLPLGVGAADSRHIFAAFSGSFGISHWKSPPSILRWFPQCSMHSHQAI